MSVIKGLPQQARMIGWTLAFFLPAVAVAMLFSGAPEALRALLSLTVCLPLAMVSLFFSLWSLDRGFLWQYGMIAGGALGRGALALTGGMLLFLFVPACGSALFWLWMAFSYLLTLAAEVTLLLMTIQQRQGPAIRPAD